MSRKKRRKDFPLRFEYVPIEMIEEYADNPRIIPESAVNLVSKSIGQFGFVSPVILNSDYVIAAGHTRYKAAKKRGLKKIPAIIWDAPNEAVFKGFNIADNQLGTLTKFQTDLLSEILSELRSYEELSLESLGFSEVDLDRMMERVDKNLGKAMEKVDEEEFHPPKVDQEYWVIAVFKGEKERSMYEAVVKFFSIPEKLKSFDGSQLYKAMKELQLLRKGKK